MGGLYNPVSEKIEALGFANTLANSGDLESATKTITATSEPSGTGNATYSTSLTVSVPTDSRLAVMRIAARIAATIDSMTATHVYCKVYVDAQDADHLLFSEDWDSTGAKLDAVDTYATSKAVIFNLLKDGAAHTFYFFFWVDSGNAVLSVVQAWSAVGACNSGSEILRLTHSGFVTLSSAISRVGTGTPGYGVSELSSSAFITYNFTSATATTIMLATGGIFKVYGTVATDLNYPGLIVVNIRSER